jgi:hypothetical protein
MLLLLIFLLAIFFTLRKSKTPQLELFTQEMEIPDLSDKNLKDSLEILNEHLNTTEYQFSHFYEALKKFNYFSYNNSEDITVLIPLNSSIIQYLTWIFSDINEISNSTNITNNAFILGNIFNDGCITKNDLNYCGPFNKNTLINKSNNNLSNNDFIIHDINYKDGIIHIVDFLLENSNDINFTKKEYFINYTREERDTHV